MLGHGGPPVLSNVIADALDDSFALRAYYPQTVRALSGLYGFLERIGSVVPRWSSDREFAIIAEGVTNYLHEQQLVMLDAAARAESDSSSAGFEPAVRHRYLSVLSDLETLNGIYFRYPDVERRIADTKAAWARAVEFSGAFAERARTSDRANPQPYA